MGAAHLSWDTQTHTLAIHLSLVGLAPKSVHPAHIHAGTCRQNQPTILWSLPPLQANGVGQATLSTMLTGVTRFPGMASLNVHNGPGLATSEPGLSVACGNIALSTHQAQVSMQATTAANQHASGEAHLTLEHQRLTVTLHLQGLVPHSLHAAHIHAGSCLKQGPVIYPLPPLQADARGNAQETATFQGVSASWYLNAHLTTTLTTQTGFDPIACGDITRSR